MNASQREISFCVVNFFFASRMSGNQVEGPTFHGGPLPFITISPTGECVVEEYAARILSQIKGKVAVVTVAGMYRTGKSYLMNRLIGMQEGFEIGPSVNPCTKGIWIWGQPVQLADDYYAILIDTEGLGSGHLNNVDLVIFTLSVLLSSFFIYNSIGPISEDTIDQLAVASTIVKAMYGKAVHSDSLSSDSGAASAPPFLWVLRDFNLKLVNEFNQVVSPRDYMENCLKAVGPNGSPEKNGIRESIKQLFEDRDCLTMVRPLESESELRQINKVPFENLRAPFKQQIEGFVEKVYTSLQPKKIGSVVLTGSSFCQLVSQYCSILNGNAGKILPGISNMAWDNVVQTQLRSSLRDAVGVYRSVLNEEGMKKLPLSDQQVSAINTRAKHAAKNLFPTALLNSLSSTTTGTGSSDENAISSELDTDASGGVNLSVSAAGEISSPSLFFREFRVRRQQLLEHLKAENARVSLLDIDKIFAELVRQVIDPVMSSGSIGLVLESWRTVVSVLDSQCSPKYPLAALSQFVVKQLIPSLVSITGRCASGGGSPDEIRRWTERVIQLEQQVKERDRVIEELQKRSARDLTGSRDSVHSLWDMVRQLQDKLAIAESQLASAPRPVAPVAATGDDQQGSSVFGEIRGIKDLLVSSLTEMKSAESDKRSVEIRAENERNMIELERKFNKQLNEARRKNELMIDDVKRNYEEEIVKLKDQKSDLQDRVRDLEKQVGYKSAEIDKLNVLIEAGENDRALRSNLANVINQQSQLVLQFLKNGAQLNPAQAIDLSKLSGQASELRSGIRPPLISGGKYSQGA